MARHGFGGAAPPVLHAPQRVATVLLLNRDLLASRRAYLLRPTGRARLVHVTLRHRGGTLPPGPYSLLFPQEVSCHATRTTVTCNQNYLAGYFYLAPRGSRSA